MGNLSAFNADENPTQDAPKRRGPAPAGDWTLAIEDASFQTGTDRDGMGSLKLVLKMAIADEGEHKDKKVVEYLPYDTKNPGENHQLAVRIGRSKLGDIYRSMGVKGLNDTSELRGVRVGARLKIINKGTWDDGTAKQFNEVVKFHPKPVTTSPPQAAPQPQAQAPQNQAPPASDPFAATNSPSGYYDTPAPSADEVPF